MSSRICCESEAAAPETSTKPAHKTTMKRLKTFFRKKTSVMPTQYGLSETSWMYCERKEVSVIEDIIPSTPNKANVPDVLPHIPGMPPKICWDTEPAAPENGAPPKHVTPMKKFKTFFQKKQSKVIPFQLDSTETSKAGNHTEDVTGVEENITCKKPQNLEKNMYRAAVKNVLLNLIIEANSISVCKRSPNDLKNIWSRLFEKIWAVVRGQKFNVSPKRLENLHKTIYKKVSRELNGKNLMKAMSKEDKDDLIVFIFTKVLMKPSSKQNDIRKGDLDPPVVQSYLEPAPEQVKSSPITQLEPDDNTSESGEEDMTAKSDVRAEDVKEGGCSSVTSSEENCEQDLLKKADCYKTAVVFILKNLMNRAVSKSERGATPQQLHNTFTWLFHKIWAQIKGHCFDLSPERLQNLHKAIFKAFRRKCFAPSKLVLILLNSRLPDSDRYIVSCFKKALLKTSKTPATTWLSSLDKSESKEMKVQSAQHLTSTGEAGPRSESTPADEPAAEFVDAQTGQPVFLKDRVFAPAEIEKCQKAVNRLVYNFTKMLLHKSEYSYLNNNDLNRRVMELSQIIWAEVEGYDWKIYKNMGCFPIQIFSHLCKSNHITQDAAVHMLQSGSLVNKAQLVHSVTFKLLEPLGDLSSFKVQFNV